MTLLDGINPPNLAVHHLVSGQPAFVAEAAVDVSTGKSHKGLSLYEENEPTSQAMALALPTHLEN